MEGSPSVITCQAMMLIGSADKVIRGYLLDNADPLLLTQSLCVIFIRKAQHSVHDHLQINRVYETIVIEI